MHNVIGDYFQFEELNCRICQEPFGNNNLSPRVLHCGHTFCTACLKVLIKERPFCPDCRFGIKVSDVNTVPIVYTLKHIAETVKEINKKNVENGFTYSAEDGNIFESLSTVTLITDNFVFPSVGTCPLHVAPQQFWCVHCELWICGTCAFLDHSGNRNKEHPCTVILASEQFKNMKKFQMKRIDNQLAELKYAAESIDNLAGLMVNKDGTITNELQFNNNLDEKDSINYKEVLNFFSKKDLELKALIEIVEDAKTKFSISTLKQYHKSLKYLDNLWTCKKLPLMEQDLISGILTIILLKVPFILQKKCRSILFCVKRENLTFYTPLKIENEEIIVTSLKQSVTENCYIFPFQELMKDRKNMRAFLRLSCQGTKLGSIEISLFDNKVARQFTLLCTAEKGPSYKWSKFFACEGLFTRHISGGDYEQNNGCGGAKIVNDVSGEELIRLEEGFVCGDESYDTKVQAQFKIFFKVGSSKFVRRPIGKVTKGLSLIKDISVKDLTKIYIEECGVIIPMKQD